jgi:hypothetical protein
MQLEDDSVVGIAFESEMIHLFDPKTGNSLLSQGDE